jgi:hypothetical protein
MIQYSYALVGNSFFLCDYEDGAMTSKSNQGTLGQFLIALGEDPAKMKDFKKNPRQFMTNAGLTPEEQNIVLSGDSNSMSQAIRGKIATKDTTIVVVVVVVVVA